MKSAPDTPANASGIHLWLVLWKAFSALQVLAYQNIHASDLGLTDFAVLELLLHKGPAPVNADWKPAHAGFTPRAAARGYRRGRVSARKHTRIRLPGEGPAGMLAA